MHKVSAYLDIHLGFIWKKRRRPPDYFNDVCDNSDRSLFIAFRNLVTRGRRSKLCSRNVIWTRTKLLTTSSLKALMKLLTASFPKRETKKAVPRDGQQIKNRNIPSIQGSSDPVRTKKIFVGGLPWTITESDFKTYLEQFGTVTDVVVMYDHNTQRPRGFGFITEVKISGLLCLALRLSLFVTSARRSVMLVA